jgi:diguanylate cyclase (GGDEF)-like protein
VEERVTLSKLPFKTYSDITGKPVFNKSGSLRIQKPNSAIFMVLSRLKQDYLLLGCAHQEPRTYEPKFFEDLSAVWKSSQEAICETIHKIQSAGKIGPPVAAAPYAEVKPVQPAVDKQPLAPDPVVEKKPVVVKNPIVEKTPVAGKKTIAAETPASEEKSRRPTLLVDEVTRLFNRDYFEECLAIEVERARRYSRQVSLIFLSVTPANNNVSNEDLIATSIAEILSRSLRRVDVICRLEKDKYAIVLPDTATHTYGIIAKRIFKYFKQIMGENPPVYLNISASTYPQHAENHISLLKNAEKLLVQAQGTGPNKAVLSE